MSKIFAKVFQTSVLPANSTPTYNLLRVSEGKVAFIAGHNLIRFHLSLHDVWFANLTKHWVINSGSRHHSMTGKTSILSPLLVPHVWNTSSNVWTSYTHNHNVFCEILTLLAWVFLCEDYLFPSSSCVHSMYNTGFTPADTDSLLKINTLMFL